MKHFLNHFVGLIIFVNWLKFPSPCSWGIFFSTLEWQLFTTCINSVVDTFTNLWPWDHYFSTNHNILRSIFGHFHSLLATLTLLLRHLQIYGWIGSLFFNPPQHARALYLIIRYPSFHVYWIHLFTWNKRCMTQANYLIIISTRHDWYN